MPLGTHLNVVISKLVLQCSLWLVVGFPQLKFPCVKFFFTLVKLATFQRFWQGHRSLRSFAMVL